MLTHHRALLHALRAFAAPWVDGVAGVRGLASVASGGDQVRERERGSGC